jgi:hypothetical protein
MTPAPRVYCYNCGEAQPEDAQFCAQCGASQTDVEEIAEAHPDGTAAGLKEPKAVLPWIATAVWLAMVIGYGYANRQLLAKLDYAGVADLVLRAAVPLALLWLAVGYFRLAARLREPAVLRNHAVEAVQRNQAAADELAELLEQGRSAVRSIEAGLEKLREYDRARLRAVQPRWEIHGRIAHEKAYEINLRNSGAAASGLSASWDKSLPMAVILSETGVVDRAGYLTLKVMFLENRLDDFAVKLHYRDGANAERVAFIGVSKLDAAIRQEEL